MADIQEPYVILSLSDKLKNDATHFPVKEYSEDDVVIITSSKNTTSFVKISDSKPFKSWSTTQNQHFTSPVISDGRSTGLLCVQNKTILRQWSSDSDSINTASKLKFESPIHELVTIKDKDPLVIFENGSCNLLSTASSTSSEATDSCLLFDETLLRSEVAIREQSICIVHKVASISEPKDQIFYLLMLSEDNLADVSVKRAVIQRNSGHLVDWTLSKDNADGLLLTLWSNGDIYKYSWDFESCHLVCTIPSNPDFIGLRSVDDTHLLLALNQIEGNVLELWDIKYNVLKRRRKIDSILDSKTQMEILNNNLWMLSGNQIFFCSITTGSSSLSSSVGRKSTNKLAEISSDSFYWNKDGVKTMESNQSADDSKTVSLMCHDVLNRLIAKKNAKAIISTIQQWKNVPEAEIFKTLVYFLDVDKKSLRKSGIPKGYSNDVFSEEKSYCLNQVLTLKFNEGFLHYYLQQLPTDKAYTLLLYLHYLLKNQPLGCRSVDELPITQVINWINILLDVHFNFFTLTNDTNIEQFLVQLNKTVDDYTQLHEEMDDLANLVMATRQGIKVPTFQNKSLYRIEIFEI